MEPGGCSISTEYLLLSGHGKEKRVRAVLVRMPGLGGPPREKLSSASWQRGGLVLTSCPCWVEGEEPAGHPVPRAGADTGPRGSWAPRLRSVPSEAGSGSGDAAGSVRSSEIPTDALLVPLRVPGAGSLWLPGEMLSSSRRLAARRSREEVCLLPRLLPAGSRSPSLKPERLPSLGPNTVFRTPTFKELPPIDSLNPSVGSRKE